jgi:glycosyltransferase involved in cell wall biosynthesis
MSRRELTYSASVPSPDAPVISVVVCAYNSRSRIDVALTSLREQDLAEPYEVIVVDSGHDGCAEYVRSAYPAVRIVRSERRLYPGPARNRGVEAARGEIVAFLPDDGVAQRDWLRRRVAKHREGFDTVGGAITNGTAGHPVGSAGYYLEYSALLPSERVLAAQSVPHCLSYRREVFERVGTFPEDTETGEDTLFNQRCVAAGVSVGFDPRIRLAHRNLTRLGPYLRHQYEHGRGLVQCVAQHRLPSLTGPIEQPLATALYRIYISYPRRRWWLSVKRIAHGHARSLPPYLALTPLVWMGLEATALGAWREWRRVRHATAVA